MSHTVPKKPGPRPSSAGPLPYGGFKAAPEYHLFLQVMGDGNTSAGLRRVVEALVAANDPAARAAWEAAQGAAAAARAHLGEATHADVLAYAKGGGHETG